MNEKSLVSVIIPFLNAEKFFEEAIESVLAQNYTEWELILVDDGSTDRSTQIAKGYRDQYAGKVIYTEHDGHLNKGISASRNLGYRKARGKYIAMLDADDAWLKYKLEQQTEILTSYPEAGMVCGNTKYWYSWTGHPEDILLDRYMHHNANSNTRVLNSLVDPPSLLILTLNGEFDPASMSNIMLRRETIERVRGFEDAFTGMHEDQAFLAKVYVNSPVFVSASCWDLYRQHRESCHELAERKGKRASTEIFYLNWLNEYLEKNKITDPELLNALNNRLWNFKNTGLNQFKHAMMQKAKNTVKTLAPKLLPRSIGEAVISKYSVRRPFGWIHFGELRKLAPARDYWGENRGNSIDTYYIDKFLKANSKYIKGTVLEIGSNLYAYKYGRENVIRSNILKIADGNIGFAPETSQNAYDCIILTQTLQFVYNLPQIIEILYRLLKPSGVILATMPGIRPDSNEKSSEKWYWNFTSSSASRLFGEQFTNENLEIACFGNSLSAMSLLHGLASEDLTQEELDYFDNRYEVLIAVRAAKPGRISGGAYES